MIYSASSLLLATLVFNAASVWGAPVSVSNDGSPVVRSTGEDILPRKTIDVLPRVRSIDLQLLHARDTASSSSASLEARDPLPEVQRMVRRFPRKVYEDFYTKRSPSPSPDGESSPPEVVERRFPRRALYERHESRSNPAPPEARSDPEPSDIQRRYPRKVYADYYQKRESSPPINVEARNPAPELTDSGRRFPRRVYAEHYAKRQEDPATAAADPAPAPAADATAATPTAAEPSALVSASVSSSASTSTATSATVAPPLDINAIMKDIASSDVNSFQPGTTIKETTLLVNKITHISDKGTAGQNPPASGVNPGTPESPATPSSSAAAASSSAPAAPVATLTPATGDAPVTPPVAAAANPESTETPPETPPAAPADEATPPPAAAAGDASRRSLGGSNQASRQPIIRRQLGYSGPAWASHLKRNVN